MALISRSLLVSLSRPAVAQPKEIYLADDDHTDFVWRADEAPYRHPFIGMSGATPANQART